MPFTHAIEDRVVHIRWSGVLTQGDLEGIGKLMPQLVRQLGFVPQVLHTYDAVTGCDFPPLAVYEHSEQRRQLHIPQPSRAASVAKTAVVRDMARVFQLLNRNPNLELEVFATEEAARAWLLEPLAGREPAGG